MNNHSKEKDQDRELFKRAISEALDLKIQEIDEEIKNVELPPQSKRHKTIMKRIINGANKEYKT